MRLFLKGKKTKTLKDIKIFNYNGRKKKEW